MKMSRSILGLSVGMMAALVVQAQAPAAAPAGTTGMCKDGSFYAGASKQGACRGHKGVKEWYGTNAAAPAPAAAATAATPAKMAAGPAPSGATGQCKDGSYYSGASKKGACRGHKGVQEWYGSATAAAPAAAAAPASAPRPAAAPAPAAAAAAPVAAAPRYTPPVTAAPGGGAGQVWVNTKSKVYHCQGDFNYGKTKEGEYMTEAAAKAAGDRPARGKACQ